MSKRLTNTRLRQWRIANELTLEELSDLTGASVSMLSLTERGLRRMRPSTKVTVARRLGVPVRDLFEVEDLEQVHPEQPPEEGRALTSVGSAPPDPGKEAMALE